jgi:hypothetical protein
MLKFIKKYFADKKAKEEAEEERLARLSKQRIETNLKLVKLFKPKPTKKIQL